MKNHIIAVLILFLAAITIWALATPVSRPAEPAASPSVSDEVIRLHILAESDSERDQNIKLALRDILLPYLNAATLGAASKEEAFARLESQCLALTDIANAALAQLGADYSATVSVETLYFPVRIYGSQTYLSEDAVIFPPGFYDSVQVVLGKGEGHNWWCLAYPSLCFIDSAYDYIPKDSDIYKIKIGTIEKNVLEELFYGETSGELLSENNSSSDTEITIYFGSKLWELLKNLFSKK